MNKNITMGKVSIITRIQLRAFWAVGLISFQPPLSTVQPNECQSESGEDNALGLGAFHYSLVLTFPDQGLRLSLWQTGLPVHTLIPSVLLWVHLYGYTCNMCCMKWHTEKTLAFFLLLSIAWAEAGGDSCCELYMGTDQSTILFCHFLFALFSGENKVTFELQGEDLKWSRWPVSTFY